MNGDIPPMPDRIPRFIPKPQLDRIAEAIRQLPDPYQRTALTIARWTGARRGEIRRLRLDSLDAYPDGYPRIHIPVGKTLRERVIPLHPEAAAEVQTLQALHRGQRPVRDEKTGVPTRYLFTRRGNLLSDNYLLDYGLRAACIAAGMEIVNGHLPITPHRFRHTVGTTLAERGASLNTIMKMLGHYVGDRWQGPLLHHDRGLPIAGTARRLCGTDRPALVPRPSVAQDRIGRARGGGRGRSIP